VINLIEKAKDTSFRWDSATYPDESHDSMVIKSYYDALRMIFAGWSYPRDSQTNFFRGSLDDVKAHDRRLGELLGFALLPPEAIVNELGYQRLRMNNLDAALAAFRFNTEHYPQSANVWDSLGEALERAGKKEEALTSYRKAVSVAEAKADPNLESFRNQVARLSATLRSSEK
ncbi:MAG TPA: hypothetical protein VG324_20370, partial [Blastocatellia bacterium]|nr:hypothetical protein [Blastocatellia bacterium]